MSRPALLVPPTTDEARYRRFQPGDRVTRTDRPGVWIVLGSCGSGSAGLLWDVRPAGSHAYRPVYGFKLRPVKDGAR